METPSEVKQDRTPSKSTTQFLPLTCSCFSSVCRVRVSGCGPQQDSSPPLTHPAAQQERSLQTPAQTPRHQRQDVQKIDSSNSVRPPGSPCMNNKLTPSKEFTMHKMKTLGCAKSGVSTACAALPRVRTRVCRAGNPRSRGIAHILHFDLKAAAAPAPGPVPIAERPQQRAAGSAAAPAPPSESRETSRLEEPVRMSRVY